MEPDAAAAAGDGAEPIAIVGFGGVFPGARTLADFWRISERGEDVSRPVPPGRWVLDPRAIVDPTPGTPDRVLTDRGCFVEGFQLDPASLDLPADALAELDPSVHLLLDAGRQAFTSSSMSAVDRARVGVIMGHIVLPTEKASQRCVEVMEGESEVRSAKSEVRSDEGVAAAQNFGLRTSDFGLRTSFVTRHPSFHSNPAHILARALGLGGVAFSLDAACASSLYALKYACDELRAGRADAMLAGGLSRPDSLYTQMGFSQLRALAASGRCAPFDAAGCGLIVGEGAGVVVLKRLGDALRDGDTILALIRGIGLSSDLEGNLLSPSSEGQLRALRAAYAQAGWTPGLVDFIECHATGTPVGDAIEFASLRALVGQASSLSPVGQASSLPVLGAVKANIGHLLTAAGSASLIKTLLAFRHATFPPVANFRQASDKIPLGECPFRILESSQPWPRRDADTPRRAAINGFGFGGINAHVLLEEWLPADSPPRPSSRPRGSDEQTATPIAIVGLAAHVGACDSSGVFQQAIFGDPAPLAQPVADLRLPLNRFRIPPRELAELLPQQALMLEVARAALADAGTKQPAPKRAAVFISLGLDARATDYHHRWTRLAQGREPLGPPLTADRTLGALAGTNASRIAKEFHFGGPAFTVSSDGTSRPTALELAVQALRQNEADQVLAGAVDFSADPRVCDPAHPPAEGAIAFVLKRLPDAQRDGDRIYAVVGPSIPAAGLVGQSVPAASLVGQSVPAAEEAVSADFPDHDRDGLFGSRDGLPHYSGSRDGLPHYLAAAQAALALYHEIHPGSPPRYWLRDRAEGPRRARLDFGTSQFVLEAVEHQTNSRADSERLLPPVPRAEGLFLLTADELPGLLAQLDALRQHLTANPHLPADALARQWWHASPVTPAPWSLAVIARDVAQLLRLLDHATRKFRHSGSLASDELAPDDRDRLFHVPPDERLRGEVAFVFPGAGNSFPGMGRELALHFPGVTRAQDRENLRLASQMQAQVFWDTAAAPPKDDHRAAICGQVALGTWMSDLATVFGLTPQAVIGYSLGESTGLFALRAWRARDEMLERVTRSALFARDLTGRPETLRAAWQLPADQPVAWQAGLVDRSAAEVRAAIAGHPRLHILIVNTPRECVIGGDATEVRALVGRLGCHWWPLEGVSTVHCELLRPFEHAYRELHRFETTPPPGVRFYSGGWGRAYTPDRETAAAAIVAQASDTVDFPRVVEAAYADGARFFIELGPGHSCSRMIAQILGPRAHLARSLCTPAQEPLPGLLRALAQFAAHGLPLDLAPLYPAPPPPTAAVPAAPSVQIPIRSPLQRGPVTSAGAVPTGREAPSSSSSAPHPLPVPAVLPADDFESTFLTAWSSAQAATLSAHQAYLDFSANSAQGLADSVATQLALIEDLRAAPGPATPAPALDRAACLEFARGHIANVLGPAFAEVDAFPTRVRLPDEPLMLVDRILEIHGQPRSMTHGRVVTEHDIRPDAWYLDCDRIPTCIAVEAGQADLFLSGYLGIDFQTRGRSVYRLLDAKVCFHRSLPGPGEVIHYDIHIDQFFQQSGTWLFRFHFEATVNGAPLLSMRDGCAGFFSAEELAGGRGIVHTAMDLRPMPGKRDEDWREFVRVGVERYSEAQLEALRAGDLAACFGPQFAGLPLRRPLTVPAGRMRLVHRIAQLDPQGGRFGLGIMRGEADIRPDDWFLTCHFVDDRVMPGTLMYECCLHTLRVLLLRLGWVAESGAVALEPVPGVVGQLKCRGQVLESTKTVTYEVAVKEIGYRPEPYVIADALMYADGKPIVEITNMSLRYTGLDRATLERTWAGRRPTDAETTTDEERKQVSSPSAAVSESAGKPVLYGPEKILAFAIGKPSEAFGEPYRVFDHERRIARLPGPPYQFLDRVTEVTGAPFKLLAGAAATAEYDVPRDAWYFAENRQGHMPFAVLLEIALQPCGWLAAYCGSALTSDTDLSFRNLGGRATQFLTPTPDVGTLTTRVKLTKVSSSAGMIIQWFDLEVLSAAGLVYRGDTYFGFFPQAALAKQEGIRDAQLFHPAPAALAAARARAYPSEPPFPGPRLRMVDDIVCHLPQGGPHGLGFIRATKAVQPEEWFFKAHFYQDPVVPGSLGLESLLQLLKFLAVERWGHSPGTHWEAVAVGAPHEWTYRGQVIPTNTLVTVEASVTAVDDAHRQLTADGFLSVDGRVIYGMKNFTVRLGNDE